MDPSRNKMITAHEDKDFFREAVLFTAGQTGLNANLIEKDYYCTVLLQYLYLQPESPLIFRGGTCIGKVYADFYRLSEDLDFLIATPPEASISVRRKRIAPLKDWGSQHKIDMTDQHLLQLVAEKLKVPENPPVDLSPARKEKLKTQINTELKPVLRPQDFASFNLDRVFEIATRMSQLLQ